MSDAARLEEPAGEEFRFRMAGAGDVVDVARLFDIANDGSASAIWSGQAGPGESWLDVAVREMSKPDNEIFYGKALLAIVDGAVAGMLSSVVHPTEFCELNEVNLEPLIRPFVMLRRQAPGFVFLREGAVFPQFRRRGLQRHLFNIIIETARNSNMPGLATTVHEHNDAMLALQTSLGFKVMDKHIVSDHPTYPIGSYVYLLKHVFEPAPVMHDASREQGAT
jgi:ribosomal protein S18 acetylase RimI-like enzyme